MSGIDKVKQYVQKFEKKIGRNQRYDIGVNDFIDIVRGIRDEENTDHSYRFADLLFNYGYAKGYRACMATQKRGNGNDKA